MKKHIVVYCLFLGIIALSYYATSMKLSILKQTTSNQIATKETVNVEPETKDGFVEEEKTVIELYEYLKTKGWKLDKFVKAVIHPFDSKEVIGVRVRLLNATRGFLIMQFSSPEIAKAHFAKIDEVYKSKFGGAILTKDFIVTFFGGNICRLEPALTEEEIIRLKQHLIEFSNSYHKITISKAIKK